MWALIVDGSINRFFKVPTAFKHPTTGIQYPRNWITLANPANLTAGTTGSIFVVQDGTGSRTVSYGSSWDFIGGTAPTMTTAASSVDRIDYIVLDSTNIHAVATLAYS